MHPTIAVLLHRALLAVLACGTLLVAPRAGADDAADKAARARSGELFQTISRLDADMFSAFNAQDLDRLMPYFAGDLEFYHDREGLQDHATVAAGFKRLFGRDQKIRRELVPGSLEVYPIGDYGAVERGAHTFCHVENGTMDCGTFQFAHVWRHRDGAWQVTRVLSFDH